MHRSRLRGSLASLALVTGVAASALASPVALGADPSSGPGKPLKFIMVIQAPSTTPFFDVIDTGLQTAGKDFGVDVEYRGTKDVNTDANEQRQLILNAIAAAPDGLIISDEYPDSFNDVIKQAVASGIPVVLTNSGQDQAEAVGALTYVGNDEYGSGALGAQQMNALNQKHSLLITFPDGAIPLVDARSNGYIETFKGATTRADIPLTDAGDPTKIKSIVETELLKDATIDSVFSVGGCCNAAMLAARSDLEDRGTTMQWGSIDVGPEVQDALKNGEMAFGLDQQQFNQGYLPVLFLDQYIKYAISPGASVVPTGPGVITAQNVQKLIDLQSQKIR